MPSKSYRPRSHALLQTLPITFTASVTTCLFRLQRRMLTLRGPVLLLSKNSAAASGQASKLVVLSPSTRPAAVGKHHVSIHGLKLSFSDGATRDEFMRVADFAVRRSLGAIDRYMVGHRIGQGASGVVYSVRRRMDGQRFAMKAIPKTEVFLSNSRLDSLISERSALAKAAQRRSVFIVRLIDAFETDRHLCFVTELAEHGDLHSVLRKMPTQGVSEEVARRLFSEAVLALEETHRMGYLFRDMKLGNLLLNANGHVKLADFGLAKKMDVEYESSSVSSGTESDGHGDEDSFRLAGRTTSFVGTRRYMSPEHLNGGVRRTRGYGAPSDVWALGVSLYIMLTGDYPFGREVSSRDTVGMFHATQNEELKFPEWIGKEVESLIRGMLDRDPLERMELREIKKHPWMEGVDWQRLQFDAENDVLREDVLNALEVDNPALDEDEASSVRKDFPEADYIASVLSSDNEKHTARRNSTQLDEFDLLGFGYLGELQQREEAMGDILLKRELRR